MLYILVIATIRATCPTHPSFLTLIIVIMCYTEYKPWSSSECNCLYPPAPTTFSLSTASPVSFLRQAAAVLLLGCGTVVTQRAWIHELRKTFRRKVVPSKLREVRSDTASRPDPPKFYPPHFLPNTSFDINYMSAIMCPSVTWPPGFDPQAASAVSSREIFAVWPVWGWGAEWAFVRFIYCLCRCYRVLVMFRKLQHHIVCFCLPCQCVSPDDVSRPTQFWFLHNLAFSLQSLTSVGYTFVSTYCFIWQTHLTYAVDLYAVALKKRLSSSASKFVKPGVRDFDLPWSPALTRFYRFIVADSDWWERHHVAGRSAPPPSCCWGRSLPVVHCCRAVCTCVGFTHLVCFVLQKAVRFNENTLLRFVAVCNYFPFSLPEFHNFLQPNSQAPRIANVFRCSWQFLSQLVTNIGDLLCSFDW